MCIWLSHYDYCCDYDDSKTLYPYTIWRLRDKRSCIWCLTDLLRKSDTSENIYVVCLVCLLFLACYCICRTNCCTIACCSSICLSGTGMHCDHVVHFSADLSLLLHSPSFWTPWHQSMSVHLLPTVFFQFHLEERWGMDVEARWSIVYTLIRINKSITT